MSFGNPVTVGTMHCAASYAWNAAENAIRANRRAPDPPPLDAPTAVAQIRKEKLTGTEAVGRFCSLTCNSDVSLADKRLRDEDAIVMREHRPVGSFAMRDRPALFFDRGGFTPDASIAMRDPSLTDAQRQALMRDIPLAVLQAEGQRRGLSYAEALRQAEIAKGLRR